MGDAVVSNPSYEFLFRIDPDVQDLLPEIKVAIGVILDVKIKESDPAADALVHRTLLEVRATLGNASVASLPRIQAFRKLYRRFGVDPGQRRPSAEALMSRAKDPAKRFPRINTLVDIYNSTSVASQLPMAAYDLGRITPPIRLRFSVEGEQHVGIGEEVPARLAAGELVYADAAMVLCRDLNWRDADATKVTMGTTAVVLFVDGCEGVTRDDVAAALDLVCDRIDVIAGGRRVYSAVFPLAAVATY